MSYDRTTKQTDRQRLLLFMISLYILYIYIDILSEIVLLLKVKNIAFWDKLWWKVYGYKYI